MIYTWQRCKSEKGGLKRGARRIIVAGVAAVSQGDGGHEKSDCSCSSLLSYSIERPNYLPSYSRAVCFLDDDMTQLLFLLQARAIITRDVDRAQETLVKAS